MIKIFIFRFWAERWITIFIWFYNNVCVFFFVCSVTTFWDSKNGSIFFIRILSGRKVNLVGTLWGQNSSGKTEILTQKIDFVIHSNYKKNYCRYNFYWIFILGIFMHHKYCEIDIFRAIYRHKKILSIINYCR